MAKAKKRKPARASYHHTADHHHFLLIVGGGFLLMIMILLMYNNLPFINMYQKQAVTAGDSMEEQSSDQQVVTIANYIYSPNTITVKAGSSVIFKNNDSVAHTATADDGSFDTGTIQPGETGKATFDKAGTYSYHCTLHPNMTGTVVVED